MHTRLNKKRTKTAFRQGQEAAFLVHVQRPDAFPCSLARAAVCRADRHTTLRAPPPGASTGWTQGGPRDPFQRQNTSARGVGTWSGKPRLPRNSSLFLTFPPAAITAFVTEISCLQKRSYRLLKPGMPAVPGGMQRSMPGANQKLKTTLPFELEPNCRLDTRT